MTKTREVTDLNITSVGLVKRGADQDAVIKLFKSKPESTPDENTEDTTMQISTSEEAADESEQTMPTPEATIKLLKENGVDLEGLVEALATLTPADEADETVAADATADVDVEKTDDDTAVVDNAPVATAAVVDETPAVEDEAVTAEVVENTVTDVVSVATDVAKDFEDRLTQQADIIKGFTTREEIAKSVEDVRTEFVTFAKEAPELGAALYRVEKNEATTADLATIITLLKRADAVVTEGTLLDEVGTSAVADVQLTNLEKVVNLHKADNPGVSQSKAVASVMQTKEGRDARLADIAADEDSRK